MTASVAIATDLVKLMTEDYSLYTRPPDTTYHLRKQRYVEFWNGLDVAATNSTSSSSIATAVNSLTGGKGRDWRKKISRHENATTWLSADKQKAYGGYGSYSCFGFRNLVKGVTYVEAESSGHKIGLPSPLGALNYIESADNAAKQAFLKRAKGSITAMNGMVALGELRETLSMIRNPAKGIRTGLNRYLGDVTKRTRKVKKKADLKRIVGETYLEHAFGWAPLASDVESAGSALNRRLNRFAGSYTRISGRGFYDDAVPGTLGSVGGDVVLRWRTATTYSRGQSVRYYGETRSVCPNPISADLSLWGFRFEEFVPTLWELTPWSFLVDYFTNIGDVLDSWTLRDSDIAWVAMTTHNRSTAIRTAREEPGWYFNSAGFIKSKPYGHTFAFSPAVRQNTFVDRRNLGSGVAFHPTIRTEIPGLSAKWINMSALAVSVNRTRRSLFR